ncbi:MAG: GTP-binding protein [Patescibacteria group bacterium]
MKRIPLTVLTGYLGSGKTTLLNHILTNNQGLKIGVVVNDFGSVNIDAKLVAKKTDSMLELSNGCMCCSMDEMGLEEALGQFIYPDSPINYIVIEASGLAEPSELLGSLSAAKRMGIRLDGIVGVIDAENIEKNAAEHQTAIDQIEYSDFLLINKVDLVTPEKLRDIHLLIDTIKPKSRVFETINGAIDLRLILDQEVFDEAAFESLKEHKSHEHEGHDHADEGHTHEHHHFQKFSFETDKPLDPIAFQAFVNEKLPLAVYRSKGFLNFGKKAHNLQGIFQLVGSRMTITWDKWGETPPKTELVFIGQDVEPDLILKEIENCIDSAPDSIEGIMPLPKVG